MRAAAAARNGRVFAPDLRVAESVLERMRGLLGIKSLPEGSALCLPGCRAIHTFFMRFNLDVLFLDSAGVVLRFERDVKPWRILWCRGAFGVIEAQAGWLSACSFSVGDVVEITDRSSVFSMTTQCGAS